MPTFEEKERAQGDVLFLYKSIYKLQTSYKTISQKNNYLNLLQYNNQLLSQAYPLRLKCCTFVIHNSSTGFHIEDIEFVKRL